MCRNNYKRNFHETVKSSSPKINWLNKIIGLSFLALASQATLPTNAYAAEVVGKAVQIKNRVTGSIGNRKLSKSDKIFAREKIRASKNSDAQLILNDNSKVIVGENSTVSLDNFVVSKGGIKKGTFKVTKGALRLISGNGKKGKYKIKTPSATIGVRGTALDVYVRSGGETDVILYNGAIDACTSSGCETLSRICEVLNIKPSGAINRITRFRYAPSQKLAEDTRFNEMWPQNGFARSHQVREWVCKANAVHELNQKKFEFNEKNRSDDEEKVETPVTPPVKVETPVTTPIGTEGECSDDVCT